MFLEQYLQIVNTYTSQEQAVAALDAIIFKGFPLAKIFLLAPSNFIVKPENMLLLSRLVKQERIGTFISTSTGLTKGFVFGNLTGSAVGVVLGLGILAIPGLGQMALSSAMLFTLISGGICTATGGVVGSLIGFGLSEAKVKEYNELIAQGKFLLVIEGTKEEIATVQDILIAQQKSRQIP